MLGHAKELEKGMVYIQPEWDSPKKLVAKIKKGSQKVIITHPDGETLTLDNLHAVRFFDR